MSKNTQLGNLVNGIFVDSTGKVGVGTESPSTYGQFVVNGTANSAGISAVVRNQTDTGGDNTRYAGLDFMVGSDNGTASIRAFRTNSAGDYSTALTFWTKGAGAGATSPTERMRISATGQIGIGVTPSSWGATVVRGFQVGVGASFSGNTQGSDAYMTSNCYYDGSNWRYITNAFALSYDARGAVGEYIWQTAPSGTAGNVVSFNERMRITSGGNVLIGTTSDSGAGKLQVVGRTMSDFFNTARGNSGSIPNATFVNIFTVSGAGMYLLSTRLDAGGGDPVNYTSFATIMFDGFASRIVANNGAILTIQMSGNTVQVRQNSGATQSGVSWAYILI
jgi:hypothetical protein